MSEYMFGAGRAAPSKANATKIDRVARLHGFSFVQHHDAGCGCGCGCARQPCPARYRHWFAGPNRGEPFGRLAAEAIWKDLEAAGLADAKGIIPKGGR
jgi:hypothetical protein